jgi:hypothetical protein
MNSMFEIITEDQYKASHSDRVEGAGVSEGTALQADDLSQTYPRNNLVYCEFCKGWYNEYHVERWEGVKTT